MLHSFAARHLSLLGDRQAKGWWSGPLRAASSPGAIRAVLEALRDTDVRSLLPQIRRPTFVLHRRGDRAVRIEAGRHSAARYQERSLLSLRETTIGSGQAIRDWS